MASTRELRRRIKSIKNTSQITKAMQMVAATKMRKAQAQALAGRPYSQILNQVLRNFLSSGITITHPLLNPNTSTNTGILLLSTDKSLCGALNTNLFRRIQSQYSLSESSSRRVTDLFYTVGAKGRNFVVKTGKTLKADFENTDIVTTDLVRQIRKIIVEDFLKGEFGRFIILYPHFVSALRQEPTEVKLLPINSHDLLQFIDNQIDSASPSQPKAEYLFEPDINALLSYSLVHFLDTSIYQALVETKASEHSARMIAMQNATDNAKDLVSDLTLSYNQIRQESITNQLLEISSAAAALE